jgi:hypothetical protein
MIMFIVFIVMFLYTTILHAGVDCSVDDNIQGAAISNYFTASTKTAMMWYNNLGATPTAGSFCSDTANVQTLMGTTGGNRVFFTLRRADRMCAGNNDGTTDSAFSDGSSSNVYHHLALLHTGGVLSFYLNGTLVNTATSGDTNVLTGLFSVCSDGVFQPANPGRFVYLATYNVAVPVAEIQHLAKSRTPRMKKTKPTGEWYFDNCAIGANCNGVAFRDHSGNGRTLTGSDGANNTGFTGVGFKHIRWFGGIN